jgi:regulator of sirC expression with transglutaminase-like and TPR domain
MLLAQSLDIPVHGINLPEHFVLAYTGNTINPDTLEYSSNNVLFYINAFSRGMVFSYKDVEVFLKQLNQESKPEYFLPCNNVAHFKAHA